MAILLFVVSFVSCVCQAVFQYLWASGTGDRLFPASNHLVRELLSLFGFQPLYHLQYFFLVPDFVVCLISAGFFWAVYKGVAFTREAKAISVPVVNTYLILPVLFLLSLTFPSLLCIPFFFAFLASTVLRIWGWDDWEINSRFFPVLFFYIIFYLVVNYLFQLPIVFEQAEVYKSVLSSLVGLKYWREQKLDFNGVAVYVHWLLSIVLFCLYSFRYRSLKVFQALNISGSDDEEAVEMSVLGVSGKDIYAGALGENGHFVNPSSGKRLPSYVVGFVNFFGWPVCQLLVLAVVLLYPSVLRFVLLIAVCVGCNFGQEKLDAVKFAPICCIYMVLLSLAGYIFQLLNMSCDVCEDVGLKSFAPLYPIFSGSELAAIGALSFYCSFRETANAESRPGVLRISAWKEVNNNSLILTDSSDDQNEIATTTDVEQDVLLEKKAIDSEEYSQTDSQEAGDGSWGSVCREGLRVLGLFLLRNTYKATLAGLYVASLIHVNLWNAGFMLFFMIFAISTSLARFGWLFLVLYTQFVLCLTYIWQLSWTESIEETSPLIFRQLGLYHSPDVSHFILEQMLVPVIILICTVIQWRLLQFAENKPSDGWKELHLAPWARVIVTFISQMWDNYGLYLCYLSMFLVSLLIQDVSGVVYITFSLLCLVLHVAIYPVQRVMKWLWVLITGFSGIVVLVRYIIQFESVGQRVFEAFNGSVLAIYFKPEDFGIVMYSDNHWLFLGLLGNTVIFLLTIYQFRTFWFHSNSLSDPLKDVISSSPFMSNLASFSLRLVMLHSQELVLITLASISVYHVNFCNSLILLALLVKYPYRNGTSGIVAVILSLYLSLLIIALYILRFSTLSIFVQNNTNPLIYETVTEWAGFTPGTEGTSQILSYLFGLFTLLLQRYGDVKRWRWQARRRSKELNQQAERSLEDTEETNEKEEKEEKKEKEETEENGEKGEGEDDKSGEKKKKSEKSNKLVLFSFEKKFANSTVSDCVKWYISHGFAIHNRAIWIFALLIGIGVHVQQPDLLSLYYLITLACVAWIEKPHSILVGLFGFFTVLFILVEYTFSKSLRLPPYPFGDDIIYPWHSWHVGGETYVAKWLLLDLHPSSLVVLDLIILWITARCSLINYDKIRKMDYYQELIEGSYTMDDLLAAPRLSWIRIRHWFFRFSSFWILVFIFAVGTIDEQLISFCYLAFSLYFLAKLEVLLTRRETLWRWARYFNFTVLLIRVLYQCPAFPLSEGLVVSPQQVFGLYKVIGEPTTNFYSHNVIAFDLVIFALLYVQSELYKFKDFEILVQFRRTNRIASMSAAMERYKEYTAKRKDIEALILKEAEERRAKIAVLRQKRLLRERSLLERSSVLEGVNGESELLDLLDIGGPAAIPPTSTKITTTTTTPVEVTFANLPEYKAPSTLVQRRVKETKILAVNLPPPTIEEEHIIDEETKSLTSATSLLSSGTSCTDYTENEEEDTAIPSLEVIEADGGEDQNKGKNKGKGSKKKRRYSDRPQTRKGARLSWLPKAVTPIVVQKEEEETSAWDLLPVSSSDWKLEQEEGEEKSEGIMQVLHLIYRNFIMTVDGLIAWMNVYVFDDLYAYNSRLQQFFYGIWSIMVSFSDLLVYFSLILNVMLSSNILSLMYPISLFLYALVETPKPNKKYFRFLWGYTTFLLCIKFLFQFRIFCECYSPNINNNYPSVAPYCPAYNAPNGTSSYGCKPSSYEALISPSLPQLIGIYPQGMVAHSSEAYIKSVALDMWVLVVLHWNKINMKLAGMWDYTAHDEEEEEKKKRKQKKKQQETEEQIDTEKITRKRKAKKYAKKIQENKKNLDALTHSTLFTSNVPAHREEDTLSVSGAESGTSINQQEEDERILEEALDASISSSEEEDTNPLLKISFDDEDPTLDKELNAEKLPLRK